MPVRIVGSLMCSISVPNPDDFVEAEWTEEVVLRKRFPPFRLRSRLYQNLFKYTSLSIINRTKQMLMVLPKNLWCFSDFDELVRIVRDVSGESDIRKLPGRIAAMEYIVRVLEVRVSVILVWSLG